MEIFDWNILESICIHLDTIFSFGTGNSKNLWTQPHKVSAVQIPGRGDGPQKCLEKMMSLFFYGNFTERTPLYYRLNSQKLEIDFREFRATMFFRHILRLLVRYPRACKIRASPGCFLEAIPRPLAKQYQDIKMTEFNADTTESASACSQNKQHITPQTSSQSSAHLSPVKCTFKIH